MKRERVGDWLLSCAESEDLMAEMDQCEENALRQGRVTLFELCAQRFLPGVTELPLYAGRAPVGVDWSHFPRRRRARLSPEAEGRSHG